jgi:hypothetical protein
LKKDKCIDGVLVVAEIEWVEDMKQGDAKKRVCYILATKVEIFKYSRRRKK